MIYDQITGYKIWKSEAVKLDTYTGKGGLYTHWTVAETAFNIDYGLVRYKIPAERPIPFTTSNHPAPDEGTTGTYLDVENTTELP